jgi:hypothetical protein
MPVFLNLEQLQEPLVEKGKSPGFNVEQINGILGNIGKVLKALG